MSSPSTLRAVRFPTRPASSQPPPITGGSAGGGSVGGAGGAASSISASMGTGVSAGASASMPNRSGVVGLVRVSSGNSLSNADVSVIVPTSRSDAAMMINDGAGNTVHDDSANVDRQKVRVEGYYEQDEVGGLIPSEMPRSRILYVLTASVGRDMMAKTLQYSLLIIIALLKRPAIFSPEAEKLLISWSTRFYSNYNTIRHARSLFKLGHWLLDLFSAQAAVERLVGYYRAPLMRISRRVIVPIARRFGIRLQHHSLVPQARSSYSARGFFSLGNDGSGTGGGEEEEEDLYSMSSPVLAMETSQLLRSQRHRFDHLGESVRSLKRNDDDRNLEDDDDGDEEEGRTTEEEKLDDVERFISGDIYTHVSAVERGESAALQMATDAASISPLPQALSNLDEAEPLLTSLFTQGSGGGVVSNRPSPFPQKVVSEQPSSTSSPSTFKPFPHIMSGNHLNLQMGVSPPTDSVTSPVDAFLRQELDDGKEEVVDVMKSTPMFKQNDGRGFEQYNTTGQPSSATTPEKKSAAVDADGEDESATPMLGSRRVSLSQFHPIDVRGRSPVIQSREHMEQTLGPHEVKPGLRQGPSLHEASSAPSPLHGNKAEDAMAVGLPSLLNVSHHSPCGADATSEDTGSPLFENGVSSPPGIRLEESNTILPGQVPKEHSSSSTVLASSDSYSSTDDDMFRPIQRRPTMPASAVAAAVAAAAAGTEGEEELPSPKMRPAEIARQGLAALTIPSNTTTVAYHSSGAATLPANIDLTPYTPIPGWTGGQRPTGSALRMTPTPRRSATGATLASPAISDDAVDGSGVGDGFKAALPASSAEPQRNRKGPLQIRPVLLILFLIRNLSSVSRRLLRDATLISSERFMVLDMVELHRPAIQRHINTFWFVSASIDLLLSSVRVLKQGWCVYATARQDITYRCGCRALEDPADLTAFSTNSIARRKTDLFFPPLDLDYGAPAVSTVGYFEAADPETMAPSCLRCGRIYSIPVQRVYSSENPAKSAPISSSTAAGGGGSSSAAVIGGGAVGSGNAVLGSSSAAKRSVSGVGSPVGLSSANTTPVCTPVTAQFQHFQRVIRAARRRSSSSPFGSPLSRQSSSVTGGKKEEEDDVGLLLVPWLMRRLFNYVWLLTVHDNFKATLLLHLRYMASWYLAYRYTFGTVESYVRDAPLSKLVHLDCAVAGLISAVVELMRVVKSAPS